jgi:hypothetical protein
MSKFVHGILNDVRFDVFLTMLGNYACFFIIELCGSWITYGYGTFQISRSKTKYKNRYSNKVSRFLLGCVVQYRRACYGKDKRYG